MENHNKPIRETVNEIISKCVDCVYGMNIDTSMKEAKRLYSELENSPLLKKQITELLTTQQTAHEDSLREERLKAVDEYITFLKASLRRNAPPELVEMIEVFIDGLDKVRKLQTLSNKDVPYINEEHGFTASLDDSGLVDGVSPLKENKDV